MSAPSRSTRRPGSAALCAAGLTLLVALPLAAQAPSGADGQRGYYRQPALHGDAVVFAAEGDLWHVSVTGGMAERLTSHAGDETAPAISADGRTVAFTATYDGPSEVYVMPIAGGRPQRLTWESEDSVVIGWTPAGEVLYRTSRWSTLPGPQLVLL